MKDAPLYDSAAQLDRKLEPDIYQHYDGRPGYRADEVKREAAISRH